MNYEQRTLNYDIYSVAESNLLRSVQATTVASTGSVKSSFEKTHRQFPTTDSLRGSQANIRTTGSQTGSTSGAVLSSMYAE